MAAENTAAGKLLPCGEAASYLAMSMMTSFGLLRTKNQNMATGAE